LINGSFLVNFFLKEDETSRAQTEGSIFYKIYSLFRNILSAVFSFFRLDKIFAGSIYKNTFIWASLTALMAPILPTKLMIVLSLAGFGSLLLALGCDREKNLRFSPVNKFIYIYAAVYFISILTSVDMKGSLFGGMLTVFFVLFAIVMENAIESKIQIKVLMFLLSGVGVLVSLYGFYQFMFPGKFGGVWVDTDMFASINFRVYSTLENPNVLGEYFLLVIPLAVAGFFISKNWLLKLYYMGCTGVMMVCLVLTYSRGCYIGILVAAAVFLVLLDRRFIILGILGLCALPFILPETIIQRFMSIGNMNDSSTSYRVYIWLGTISMLKDYWLSGIGPGQSAYNKVYPFYGYNGISAPHAHNTFLQIMCDAGIMGIITFMLIVYQYIKNLFISYLGEKDFEAKVLSISAMSSFMAFMVQSMFDYTFYNYRVMLLFWIFVGMGVVFTQYSSLKD
ncbi:MAG: O-antigen ligase family protein, partial [Firmicutes bacterium]|nr:O-antigen ligase family protein [Bacillota bacterium]